MREPNILESPSLMPGTCMFCGSSNGPVVDLMQELPPYGRMYLCTHTCVPMIAGKLGYLDSAAAEGLHEIALALTAQLGVAAAEIAALQAAVADASPKVVSIDTVRQLLGKGATTKNAAAASDVPA